MRMHAQLRMYARFKETLLVPCILLGAHHILAGQAHCDSSVVEVPHLELDDDVDNDDNDGDGDPYVNALLSTQEQG